MKKSADWSVVGAVQLLTFFVVATSAVAQGTSVPPPPVAPSSDIPDILKPKTVPATPGKTPGTMKPGLVPPPPGKAPGTMKPGLVPPPPGKASGTMKPGLVPPPPGTMKPGLVPPPPGKTPDTMKPRAVPPPLGKTPGTMKPRAVPPPLGKTPGTMKPRAVPPPLGKTPDTAKLITANSIRGIKLGMTIGEAKRVVGSATFYQDTDRDEIPVMVVNEAPDFIAELYFDYEDPGAPVKDGAVINFIVSWGIGEETAEGVKVGMSLAEVEKIYGKVEEIWRNDVGLPEFVIFSNSPSGLGFGVTSDAGTAGVYRADEHSTTVYVSDTRLLNIDVQGRLVMDDESIAGIKIGDSEGDVRKAMATQALGRVDKGEEWMSDAIGAKIQTWDLPDSGLSLDMVTYEGEPKSVMSINLYSPSSKQTSMGIGIGAQKVDAMRAYEEFIVGTEDADKTDFFGSDDVHLVGSIYGGLVIHFDQGKVSNIFLGAYAE